MEASQNSDSDSQGDVETIKPLLPLNANPLENDLSRLIPGLYRLLDLCKDNGSNGLVVESVTDQTLMTRKKVTDPIEKCLKIPVKDFGKMINGHALSIDRNLDMKSLVALIRNGLPEMEDELEPFEKAL
ncbi:6326_t:CDS:2 [Acaulospora colombiana]|uniref:6326_t:CDS:1 n=1 Tax=Acaulospora colombiana TaxID=27376 RepID=A0ACA9JWF8_9GLOM|nr:6326_t:CDS:2 [Acaulospora colombiana]